MSFWPKDPLSIGRNFLELFVGNNPRILLGRSGYYRRVVKYFSSIVSTLIKLTRRGVTFDEMIAVCVVFKSERISLLGYYHYFPC